MEEDKQQLQPTEKESLGVLRKLPTSDYLRSVLLPSLFILVIILVGGLTGFFLSRIGGTKEQIITAPGTEVKGGEIGIEDPGTFRDKAEGILEKGGIDGEGTHHLVRNGGPSQYVYLTSSVIDLDQFTGKRVEVWGETFSGQKAGWLMDVGKIKILE